MEEWKCEKYYDMTQRDSFTIGTEIPEEIQIEGRVIPLKHLAFDISSKGEVPDKYDTDLKTIKRNLRRERNNMSDKLEECTVESEDEAQNLVDQIRQIDRALSVMSDPGETDVESEVKRNEAVKQKKWQEFLKKVKDSGSNNKGRR